MYVYIYIYIYTHSPTGCRLPGSLLPGPSGGGSPGGNFASEVFLEG